MKCPIDNTTLTIANRNGVEIDYCPDCRGIWLDRGELDKIIDRNEAIQTLPQPQQMDEQGRPRQKKRRESFLSDLFDF